MRKEPAAGADTGRRGADSQGAEEQSAGAGRAPAREASAREAAAAQRALAWKLVGLVFGLALLIVCAFTVSHLPAWGKRFGMVWVFLVFVLAMMIASQFTVGGASALWQALLPDTDPPPAAPPAAPAGERADR